MSVMPSQTKAPTRDIRVYAGLGKELGSTIGRTTGVRPGTSDQATPGGDRQRLLSRTR